MGDWTTRDTDLWLPGDVYTGLDLADNDDVIVLRQRQADRMAAIADVVMAEPDLSDAEKVIAAHQLSWRYAMARPAQIEPSEMHDLWVLLGGRGCIAAGSMLETVGGPVPVEDWGGGLVRSRRDDGELVWAVSSPSFMKGVAPLFRVTTDRGDEIVATARHRFLSPSGWVHLGDVVVGSSIAVAPDASTTWGRVASIEPVADGEYWDLTVPGTHNYVANGIIHHNSGKNRTASETLAMWALANPGSTWFAAGPTREKCRTAQFEGESGLLAALPVEALLDGDKDKAYNRSELSLTLVNGAKVFGLTSEKPGSPRGPNFWGGWLDEPAEAKDANRLPMAEDTFFSNLALATRSGREQGWEPKIVVTGTPKPVKLLAGDRTAGEPGLLTGFTTLRTIVSKMSSIDNLLNLSRPYERLIDQLQGKRIGRQEIYAELLDDIEGAMWRQAWIQLGEIDDDTRWVIKVVAVDPAVEYKESSDEVGIVAAGLDVDGVFWVLADRSGRFRSSGEWTAAAKGLADEVGASKIILEKNQGGQLVVDTLRNAGVDPRVIEPVTASVSKWKRSEAAALLFEPSDEFPEGRVLMADRFPELVGQLTSFTGRAGGADDRVDAMVYAIRYCARFDRGGRGGSAGRSLDGLLNRSAWAN